jgi:pSer/pThr/pTyr-binding forkhead associated (FHA) protein
MAPPPIDTGYERSPLVPSAPFDMPAGVPSGHRDIAPRLRLRKANGTYFELAGRATYLIGRRDSSGHVPDLDLGDFDGAASGVSRRHAALHVVAGNVYIEDLHSRNQTIRNGAQLLPGQRYLLADGDRLSLGMIELLVVLG